MRKLALLIAVTAIAGCATSKQIQGPSGGKAYVIKCGSAMIEKCYEEASAVCPNGYTMADRQSNANGVIVGGGGTAILAGGPNKMLVECKP